MTKRSSTLSAVALCAAAATAQPTVVEPGWTLARTVSLVDVFGAAINPADGRIYAVARETGGGIYRIDGGVAVPIWNAITPQVSAVRLAHIEFTEDGTLFASNDFEGEVYKIELDAGGDVVSADVHLSGFVWQDDDPVGFGFAPATYSGPFAVPGQGIVVDRGFNGVNGLYTWDRHIDSSEEPFWQNETGGLLEDPTDLAFSDTDIYVVDDQDDFPGKIFRIDAQGTPIEVPVNRFIEDGQSIVYDAVEDGLLVADGFETLGSSSVLRVDPATGDVSDVITGFIFEGGTFGALSLSPDGSTLLVADRLADSLYVFEREAVCYPDCTGEGMLDIFDFLCFQDAFVQGQPYANCDGNASFDIFDFLCFQDAFVIGCP